MGSLRVIAGELRGRKFKGPQSGDSSIRPSSNRLREGLFNMLFSKGLDFEGSSGLDLFAGTGALGIEACSRGAEKVLWVDESPVSEKIIHENLLQLNLFHPQKRWMMRLFCIKALHHPKLKHFKPLRWIFMDPPYQMPEIPEILKEIEVLSRSESLLEAGAWVILETSSRDDRGYAEDILLAPFEYSIQKVYGDSVVHGWQYRPID